MILMILSLLKFYSMEEAEERMSRKKKEKNYLDLVPERAEALSWEAGEDGILVLRVENKGIFNRIAQKMFKKPKHTKRTYG